MAEFIARWFTPSDSDQQSGAQYNQQLNQQQQAAAAGRRPAEMKQELRAAGRPKKKTVTKFGGVQDQAMLSAQADMTKKTVLGA